MSRKTKRKIAKPAMIKSDAYIIVEAIIDNLYTGPRKLDLGVDIQAIVDRLGGVVGLTAICKKVEEILRKVIPLSSPIDPEMVKQLILKKYRVHRYTCVATEYIADDPNVVARATVAVTDLLTDEMIEMFEFWPGDNIDDYTTAAVMLAKKYNVPLTHISKPVPLQKCTHCDCGGYMTNVITSKDIARYEHDQHCLALS